MTEHEMLKAICDKIGFESEFEFDETFIKEWSYIFDEIVDVREIIFTQEFMDKFNQYRYYKDIYPKEGFDLMKNLDNPVDYLYNL